MLVKFKGALSAIIVVTVTTLCIKQMYRCYPKSQLPIELLTSTK